MRVKIYGVCTDERHPMKIWKVFLAIELTFPRNWTGDVNKTCPFPPDFYQIMLDFVENYS